MRQETVPEHRVRSCGFGFGGLGKDQQSLAQLSVICGRAATWERAGDDEDDDLGPNIVRGRE